MVSKGRMGVPRSSAGIAAVLVAGVAACFAQQKGGPALPGGAAQMQQQQLAMEQAKSLAVGQSSIPTPNPRQTGSNSPFTAPSSDEPPAFFQESVRVKRNDERQKRLESDTQRLLGLANQLKNEVAVSGAESMTPEMLRQMDEIEKLAKSVKERMRN